MLYPFMTLNDGTEIVYSSPIQNGSQEQVKVQIETPVENGFIWSSATTSASPVTNNFSKIVSGGEKVTTANGYFSLISFSNNSCNE